MHANNVYITVARLRL